MPESESFNAPVLVDGRGRPLRPAIATACPRCGAGPDVRVASSGFGVPHPVCPCGHEWPEQVWRG